MISELQTFLNYIQPHFPRDLISGSRQPIGGAISSVMVDQGTSDDVKSDKIKV